MGPVFKLFKPLGKLDKMPVWLRYYWNSILVSLGFVGYFSVYFSYFYNWLVVFAPLIVLFWWTFSIGALLALAQLGYTGFLLFRSSSRALPGTRHHLFAVLLAGFAYLAGTIAMAIGAVITV